jgi:transposase
MADVPEDVQRWTAKRRVALVVSIVKGETSIAEAAPKHGLTVAEIEDWQERFFLAAENALRAQPKDEEALKDEQRSKKLKQWASSSSTWISCRRPRRAALWTRRRPASERHHAGRLRASGLWPVRGTALGGGGDDADSAGT